MLGWVIAAEQRWAATVEGWTWRRLLVAVSAALMLAVAVAVAAIDISPLCVLYGPGDIMWWVLGCWGSGPPPPWPNP